MREWAISPQDEAAYLDLRGDELAFDEAERLLETIQPYYSSPHLKRIILDVRGLDDPLPGPVETLIVGIEAQAQTVGVSVEVARSPDPT